MYKLVVLFACLAVALGDSRPRYGSHSDEAAAYRFAYRVLDQYSNNDFGHSEERDDDDTRGSYYVQLPDGRRQTVTYYVNGGSGYVADVKYSGEAQFPSSSNERYGKKSSSEERRS